MPCGLDEITEQNVNNQSLTQVSNVLSTFQFVLMIIRSWLNLSTSGHGDMICMPVIV